MMPAVSNSAIASPPVLQTERMVLRPVEETFKPHIFSYLSDYEVRHQMKMPTHDTPEKLDKWWSMFQTWMKNLQAVQWCAFSKQEDAYIGLFTLKELDLSNSRGELGYSLKKSKYGKGYATEGGRQLVDYAFQHIKLHSLFAQILPYNKPSQAVAEKLGFEKEAHFVESHFYEGKYYDVLQYGLLNPNH